MNGGPSSILVLLQEADVAPTTQAPAAVQERERQYAQVMQRWTTLKTHDLASLNAQLKQANLPAVTVESGPSTQ